MFMRVNSKCIHHVRPPTPGVLGGGGPPAEQRGVLGAPFAYRPIRRTDRSARPEMILKPLGWSAKVVLTGIDALVMKGDWIGALHTFIDPTVSSSV
jgi:hypothetical protein